MRDGLAPPANEPRLVVNIKFYASQVVLAFAIGAAAAVVIHFPPDPEAPVRSIVLRADDHVGRDPSWERQPAAGQPSWGIGGDGEPVAGSIWFDAFPGQSGRYRVELGAVLERDGNPQFRVLADGAVLVEGRYPHACNRLMCAATPQECPNRAAFLELGVHEIRQGARIEFWGRATYPCGTQGAYARWYEVRFTPVPADSP